MTENHEDKARIYSEAVWGLVMRGILFAVICWAVYKCRSVVGSVVAALVMTCFLLPAVNFLCRKYIMKPKLQRMLATAVVFIVFLAVLGYGIWFFGMEFSNASSEMIGSADDMQTKLERTFIHATQLYNRYIPVQLKDILSKGDTSNVTSWLTSKAVKFASAAGSTVHFIVELILIPILAFYFIIDSKNIKRELYGLVPPDSVKAVMRIERETGNIINSYLVGQLILCVISGVLTAVFLIAFKMPYAALLAAFAGVTRFVPMIGPVLSGIPIALVALLCPQGDWNLVIYSIIFVTVMHFTESKFIMPKLIGSRLNINPAMIIISLLVGAELCGFAGMFLAVPIYAVLRGLLRVYYILPKRKADSE